MKLFSKDSFLFPTPEKVILTVVLFFLFGLMIWPIIITPLITDFNPVGFPLVIRAEGLCPPTYVCIEFRWISLVIDVMVWYLFSAAVIHAHVKFWTLCLYLLGITVGVGLITILLLSNGIVL
jgi:hypothetical protein